MSEIVSHHQVFNNKPICKETKNLEWYDKNDDSKLSRRFPHYSSFEDRMKSYDSWSGSMKIKPKALSEAGFFYLGHDDRTVCFHCGGGLNEWKEFDDPWIEHAYWFPKCQFVLNEKGAEFVNKAVNKKAEIISVQDSDTIANAIEEIIDMIHSKKKRSFIKPKKETIPSVSSDSENKNSQPSLLCKICFSEEKNILFFPCKHVAVCSICSVPLKKCPICRQSIIDTIRIYNS